MKGKKIGNILSYVIGFMCIAVIAVFATDVPDDMRFTGDDVEFDSNVTFDSGVTVNSGVTISSGCSGYSLEGDTADAYETTIIATDPTADNTITLPDDSGTVSFVSGSSTYIAAGVTVVPVTYSLVEAASDATAETWNLANGEDGQVLTFTMETGNDADGTLTPTTSGGWGTIVFKNPGHTATLMYVDDTVGWVVLGVSGITDIPYVTAP